MPLSKEVERLNRLKRRLAHLDERIPQVNRSPDSNHFDRAEASALRWAIALCELAISNWPAGVEMATRLHENYNVRVDGNRELIEMLKSGRPVDQKENQ